MSRLNKSICPKDERKTKVVQFGFNNFVKGTTLRIIDVMNEAGVFNSDVAVVLPNAGVDVSGLQAQDNLYTVILEGLIAGDGLVDSQVVTNISQIVNPYTNFDALKRLARLDTIEFLFYNTADDDVFFDEEDTNLKEPKSFIGKVLAFMLERFNAFSGDITKGFHFIPCEKGYFDGEIVKDALIKLAKKCKTSSDFHNWILYSNTYAKSFMDRIVRPADAQAFEEGDVDYDDTEAIKTEHFYNWIIEGTLGIDKVFPAGEATDIEFVDDITPYIDRANRIKCGTMLALRATKKATTKEAYDTIEDFINGYINEEAAGTIDLLDIEIEFYAESLVERYNNPYITQDFGSYIPKACCIEDGIVQVILKSETLAKRALLILANHVVEYNIDLGADPELLEIDKVDGATAFLNEAIEEVKANGFLAAVNKYFN